MEMEITDIFKKYPPNRKCNKSRGCYGRGYYTLITKKEEIRSLCKCVTKQMQKDGIDLEKLTITNAQSAIERRTLSIDDVIKSQNIENELREMKKKEYRYG